MISRGLVGASLLACAIACAACGGKSKPSNSPPAPSSSRVTEPDDGGPICASTAAKYYAPALARARGTRQQELFELQRDAMIESCRANGWSIDARRCFAERTIDDNTCVDRLSPPQRDDWRQRSAAAIRSFESGS